MTERLKKSYDVFRLLPLIEVRGDLPIHETSSGETVKQEKKHHKMGTAPIPGLLGTFATPIAFCLFLDRATLFVDGIIVGQTFGSDGLAILSIGAPWILVLTSIGVLIGDGYNALAALFLGEKKHSKVSHLITNMIVVYLVLSIVLAVFAFTLLHPILTFMGTPPQLFEETLWYMQITFLGFLPLAFTLGISTLFRATGSPNTTLFLAAIEAISHVVFSIVLVSNMGAVGVAWSTLISGSLAGMVTLIVLARSGLWTPSLQVVREARFSWPLLRHAMKLGMPSCILRLSSAAVLFSCNGLITLLGSRGHFDSSVALAALTMASRVEQFLQIPGIAFGVAVRNLAAYNHGLKKPRRVIRLVAIALVIGVVATLPFWFAAEVVAEGTVQLFGFAANDVSFGVWAMRVYVLLIPLVAIRIITTNFVQALSQQYPSALITFVLHFVCILPVVLVTVGVLPLLGIAEMPYVLFIGVALGDLMSALVAGLILFKRVKRIRNESL